jgi:hypothetical protein
MSRSAIRLKPLPNSDYWISAEGILYREWMAKRRRLKCPLNVKGYRGAHLRFPDGSQRHAALHVLVLEAFVGPCPPGHETKFKDGDRTNCTLENLAWVPIRRAAFAAKGEQVRNVKLTETIVIEVRHRAAMGECVEHFAHEYGMSPGGMRAVVNGAKWKHVPGALKRKSGPRKLDPSEKAPRKSRAHTKVGKKNAKKLGLRV